MHGGRRVVLTSVCLMATVVACVLGAVAVRGQLGDRDGDAVARDNVEEVAQDVGADLGQGPGFGWAEDAARDRIPREYAGGNSVDPWTAELTPLGWAGRTWGSEQATVDVRISVRVGEFVPAAVGAQGHSAGQATRCYRFRRELHRPPTRREIDCPDRSVTPPVPRPSPVPRLPDDIRNRLESALRAATPEILQASVLSVIPEPYLFADTAVEQGTLVAAVGVRGEPLCFLLVKTPDGEVHAPAYDPKALRPGGPGCSTKLFTR
ncbi:hypothetical protein [Asanoa iriomotensis]|uniref:Uncharacterized protein n=1 Tax=Asanoa iriomotensis TaxID=234613 RepID=A0ABQ4BUF0_9ACTN|nr:hypothetical protein [Asanoa iriomotensis]GIF54158.1 hypothetical protein Air01nite_02530 [Asanoa iriomotensis]